MSGEHPIQQHSSSTRETLVRLEERLRTFSSELRAFVKDAKAREEKRHEEDVLRAREEAALIASISRIADDVLDARTRLTALEQTGPQTPKVLPPPPQTAEAGELSKAKTKVYLAIAALCTTLAGATGALVAKLLGAAAP